jgi:hypothetical protein
MKFHRLLLLGAALLAGCQGEDDVGSGTVWLAVAPSAGTFAPSRWFIEGTDYDMPPGQYPWATPVDEAIQILLVEDALRPDELQLEIVGTGLMRTPALLATMDRVSGCDGGPGCVTGDLRVSLDSVSLPLQAHDERCPSATNALVGAHLRILLFGDAGPVDRVADARRIRGELYNTNSGSGAHELAEGECTIEGSFEIDVGAATTCAHGDVRLERCDGIDNDCDGAVDDEDWICAPTQRCGGAAGCISE